MAASPSDAPAAPRSPWLSGRSAVLLLLMVVLVASYASTLRAWLQQREDLARAQERIATSQAEVDALSTVAQRWQDPAYVERQARERLSWVLPGEVGYRVLAEDGNTLGPVAHLDAPVRLDEVPVTWYASLWGSVEQAGKTPAQLRAERQPAVSGVLRAPAQQRGAGSGP